PTLVPSAARELAWWTKKAVSHSTLRSMRSSTARVSAVTGERRWSTSGVPGVTEETSGGGGRLGPAAPTPATTPATPSPTRTAVVARGWSGWDLGGWDPGGR